MAILPSAASLLARQVRLIISPPTTTLFESRAILSDIQSKFGPISTFLSQRNEPALRQILSTESRTVSSSSQTSSQTILAIFDAPASKNSALHSEHLTISCGGDLEPSPKQLDPYNARGFHGRHHPPRRTFTCHIVEEHDPTIYQRLTKTHLYADSFRIDTLQMSYRDLLKFGAALKEMADVMQTERMPSDGRRKPRNAWSMGKPQVGSSKGFYSNSDLRRDDPRRGGLMGAWERGLGKEKAEQDLLYE
jgi:hypothetical protein